MPPKYEPALSKELHDFLEKQGTLHEFLNDYRQMCTNFKPAKIYVKDKEDRPKKHLQLSPEEVNTLGKLGKSYAHALHNLLELGLKLHKAQKKYAVIGGMGVLGHLYRQNPHFPLKWRGTEDIDILSSDDLTQEYQSLGMGKIPPERVSTSAIPDGRLDTYLKQNPYHDRPLKIQDRKTLSFSLSSRKDESTAVHKEHEVVSIYGVPISVASKRHLIATKTGIRTRKDKLGHLKDLHDINHLKSIKKLEDIVKAKKE